MDRSGQRGGRGGPSRGRGRGRGQGGNQKRGFRSGGGPQHQAAPETPPSPPQPISDSKHFTDHKFADLKGQLDDRLLSAIPFPTMSAVQAATLTTALSGRDVLAQAKTGTGKTLAFLIPAIQKLCTLPKPPSPESVSVLILSPTRELAIQIEKEAHMLLSNLQGRFGVQHVVGGTNINAERTRLRKARKDFLIATPGRLLDHLTNDTPGLDLKAACQNLKVLVLDEADRMLDMGFRNELQKIFGMLPDPVSSSRQSLYFSATIPNFVHDVAKLRPDHAFISTLTEGEENTHQHVPQESLFCPVTDCFPRALQVVLTEASRYPEDHKMLAFLPTARATSLAASIFTQLRSRKGSPYAKMGPIFEIHSRKSQAARTRIMKEFQESRSGILFSSDVTARGIDIPGISMVLQVGLPSSADQYIHRLGRTARAGKDGRGVIILADFESFFMNTEEVKKLPITPLEVEKMQRESGVDLQQVRNDVDEAMRSTDLQTRAQAYQANLGFYKAYLKAMKWNSQQLVLANNDYAKNVLHWPAEGDGVWKAPPLLAKTVGMMGLKGVPGLHIVKQLPDFGGDSSNNGARGAMDQGPQTNTNGKRRSNHSGGNNMKRPAQRS